MKRLMFVCFIVCECMEIYLFSLMPKFIFILKKIMIVESNFICVNKTFLFELVSQNK